MSTRNPVSRIRQPLALLGLVLLLSGCAGQVIISTEFPDPVVTPLPYRAGVFYAPEFSDFVYSEQEPDISFQIGTHQRALYDKVFNAMFLQAVAVPSNSGGDVPVDLVIQPVLTEYAFLTPMETATDFYAVSMKYQIRIFSPEGEVVGFWPFVAYGKSRTQILNKNESLGHATTMALRDAAAAMVSQFRGVLEKEEWKTAAVTP